MKDNRQNASGEEDPGAKRKASVGEIRDLYSALQGLVPSTPPPVTVSDSDDVTERDCKPIQPKRSSYPSRLKAQPMMMGRRRSNSMDAGLASLSKKIVMRQDSINVYRQNKSLNKTFKQAKEELFNIVKDFDETAINRNRIRRRSLSLDDLVEITPTSEVTENDSIVVADEIDAKNKSEHLNLEIGNSSLQSAPQIPGKDSEFQACDAKDIVSNTKRLSTGDILERQRRRFSDSRTPYRRRSIGGSLLLNAIVSSVSTSPTRKGSLASALNLIARKDELQEFLKNYEAKERSGKMESIGITDETDHGSDDPQISNTKRSESTDDIQKEMKQLLESLEELQLSNSEFMPEDVVLLNASDESRRQSVGTEIHNLLDAIRELLLTGESSPSSTPSESNTSSRRPSLTEGRQCPKKESLDELETYFKTKLDNISESDAYTCSSGDRMSKSGKDSKTKNPRLRNRRRSASQIENQPSLVAPPPIPKSSSFANLLNPNNMLKGQRKRSIINPKVECRVMSRRRSRSEINIKLPERHEISTNNTSTNSSTRLKRRSNYNPRSTSADRELWKMDQLMFAEQVNKRLQDWLERATSSVSLQDETKEESEGNLSIVITSCSSDNDADCKSKKSRFGVRKAIRKKVNRSGSINDLSEPEPKEERQKSPRFKRGNKNKIKRSKSLHSLLDQEEAQPKQAKQKSSRFKPPQNLLRLGRQIMRSKSVHDVSKMAHLESKTTESDENFDDALQLKVDRKSENVDYNDDTITNICSFASTSDDKGFVSPKSEKKREKSNCKRVSKFPAQLPLFYTPGCEEPTLHPQTTKDKSSTSSSSDSIKQREGRKSLLFGTNKTKHRIFYEQTSPNEAPLCPLAHSSSPTIDEGYIRSPSLERFNDSPSISPDFNNFRYRTKSTSTESEDSGCPISV